MSASGARTRARVLLIGLPLLAGLVPLALAVLAWMLGWPLISVVLVLVGYFLVRSALRSPRLPVDDKRRAVDLPTSGHPELWRLVRDAAADAKVAPPAALALTDRVGIDYDEPRRALALGYGALSLLHPRELRAAVAHELVTATRLPAEVRRQAAFARRESDRRGRWARMRADLYRAAHSMDDVEAAAAKAGAKAGGAAALNEARASLAAADLLGFEIEDLITVMSDAGLRGPLDEAWRRFAATHGRPRPAGLVPATTLLDDPFAVEDDWLLPALQRGTWEQIAVVAAPRQMAFALFGETVPEVDPTPRGLLDQEDGGDDLDPWILRLAARVALGVPAVGLAWGQDDEVLTFADPNALGDAVDRAVERGNSRPVRDLIASLGGDLDRRLTPGRDRYLGTLAGLVTGGALVDLHLFGDGVLIAQAEPGRDAWEAARDVARSDDPRASGRWVPAERIGGAHDVTSFELLIDDAWERFDDGPEPATLPMRFVPKTRFAEALVRHGARVEDIDDLL